MLVQGRLGRVRAAELSVETLDAEGSRRAAGVRESVRRLGAAQTYVNHSLLNTPTLLGTLSVTSCFGNMPEESDGAVAEW